MFFHYCKNKSIDSSYSIKGRGYNKDGLTIGKINHFKHRNQKISEVPKFLCYCLNLRELRINLKIQDLENLNKLKPDK